MFDTSMSFGYDATERNESHRNLHTWYNIRGALRIQLQICQVTQVTQALGMPILRIFMENTGGP
jgi:hypothetical protein